ncbi:CaiB/BaiF CoA transferase family protein [Paracandidimonas soli]|uniref:Formyl-CoA transferase n=1 Tax=Paracandidimonas soli TaxID=1917182 RepID=A0A4R3VCR0_9BURK|nr:formyl-CoA transferase [Paracandidimonas soli]
MTQLLNQVRVLDLTNVLAGPYACYQLAQLGAEVIKVERPLQGDLARQLGADAQRNAEMMGVSFLAQNAGKQSVTIDFKHPQGKALFKKLVATADVVVENFRAGVMDRLGLGYDDLKEIKPDLIYCAISGFGQDGPMSTLPAYDQIIQGQSGLMSVTGDAQSGPLRVGYPVCDTIGGMTAAFAIASALFRRERTGQGESIDVSMLESTLGTMGWVVSNWLVSGIRPERFGNQNMTAVPSGTFKTGDGLINIAANQQAQFERLAKAVGHEEWLADPRFETRDKRKQHREQFNVLLEAALRERSATEWSEIFNARDIPAGEVRTVEQALDNPHMEARGFIKTVRDETRGDEIKVVRSGFRLESGDPAPTSYPPRLGEHTLSILESLGLSTQEIAALQADNVI